MVGGQIVSIRQEPDRLCLIVAKQAHGHHESLGVDIEKTAHPLKLGDSLWWQGEHCYWTPQPWTQGERFDIPIPRKSHSYSVGITDR